MGELYRQVACITEAASKQAGVFHIPKGFVSLPGEDTNTTKKGVKKKTTGANRGPFFSFHWVLGAQGVGLATGKSGSPDNADYTVGEERYNFHYNSSFGR